MTPILQVPVGNKQPPLGPSARPHTIEIVLEAHTHALDPIHCLGAQLWVPNLAPFQRRRRIQVDGQVAVKIAQGRIVVPGSVAPELT